MEFKYISCSYLSCSPSFLARPTFIQIHLMFLFIGINRLGISKKKLFKYISCSYLSLYGQSSWLHCSYSNTSHVLIYPRRSTILSRFVFNSNTSHVLIYQTDQAGHTGRTDIQIHLMFLFIRFFVQLQITVFQFKYISCSYLS